MSMALHMEVSRSGGYGRGVPQAYLVDPLGIRSTLASLSALTAVIDEARDRTSPSAAFRNMRKSESQIYRLLAASHCPHVQRSLSSLDAACHAGIASPNRVMTRGREEFRSLLS